MSGPSALRVVPRSPDRATMGRSAHHSHSDGVWVQPRVWLRGAGDARRDRVDRSLSGLPEKVTGQPFSWNSRARPACDKRDPSAGVSPLANEDVLSSLLRSDIVAKDDQKDWDPIAFDDHYGFTEGRDAWPSDVPGRAPGRIPRPKLIGRGRMASPRPSALMTRTPLERMEHSPS